MFITRNSNFDRTYLKRYHIDIGNQIPFGISITFVAIETESGYIANGISQQPCMIVFETDDGRWHHYEPNFVCKRCAL